MKAVRSLKHRFSCAIRASFLIHSNTHLVSSAHVALCLGRAPVLTKIAQRAPRIILAWDHAVLARHASFAALARDFSLGAIDARRA